MSTNPQIVLRHQTGVLLVIGYTAPEMFDHGSVLAHRDQVTLPYHDQVTALIKEHSCRILAFDLTGVKSIPSGLLDVVASIRQMGIRVHLYNPSEDVCEVLDLTRLCQTVPVHFYDDESQFARVVEDSVAAGPV